MGKKRIIKQTKEELLQERQQVESRLMSRQDSARSARGAKQGRVYISSSYNNTMMTLADAAGNVLSTASAGALGFRGAKKSTPFAASKVAESLVLAARNKGVERVFVYLKGIGSGRESAIRTLAAKGIDIAGISDITPIPHNGPRPPRPRRV